MPSIMEQLVYTLRNNPNHTFDFVHKNLYLMSKEEMRYVIKELVYAIVDSSDEIAQEILESVASELEYYI